MAEADPRLVADDVAVEEPAKRGAWQRGWASAGAILATIALIALVAAVTFFNRARDDALRWERHTYDVMLLTRTVDGTISRAESTLARYVLDEVPNTGRIYYSEWRAAGRQIDRLGRLAVDPAQKQRVADLRELYRARGRELALAATSAAQGFKTYGVDYFYAAGQSETGPALRAKLDLIADAERENLRRRMDATRLLGARAETLTEWLGWFAVLVGVGAIGLGLLAYQALAEQLIARREADTEADRAFVLDQAVQQRTRELQTANERLRAEAGERAAAEARLRQVQKMEAVGQLTGGIAHDFNNMLAVIVGGLDLAKRRLATSQRDALVHLDNAMEGATRAAALTRRLLAFARSEPLRPQAIAPAALVEGMLDLVDRSLGEGVSVRTRFPDDTWRVWADANLLENAILNLCVNARDAMAGKGQLTIAVDHLALGAGEIGALPAGDYVQISVSDTGSGIAPEHLERVFEPFFTTKPVGKGTGLGLSQIFGFARQSGGDVTASSEFGVGTTFSIYLPRSARVDEPGSPRGTPVAAPDPAVTQPGARILVVEDDPRVSRSTVAALEELGYKPIACASGAEALAFLGRGAEVALIITDVMMPEMTGPELVRQITIDRPDLAILFVTGFVGETGEIEALEGYDMLRKPFTVAGLATAVATALGQRPSGSRPSETGEAAA